MKICQNEVKWAYLIVFEALVREIVDIITFMAVASCIEQSKKIAVQCFFLQFAPLGHEIQRCKNDQKSQKSELQIAVTRDRYTFTNFNFNHRVRHVIIFQNRTDFVRFACNVQYLKMQCKGVARSKSLTARITMILMLYIGGYCKFEFSSKFPFIPDINIKISMVRSLTWFSSFFWNLNLTDT